MIKTLLFDNNGVLAYGDAETTIPAFAKYFDVNSEYLETFFHDEAKAFDAGSISSKEFYANIAEIIGKPFDYDVLKKLNFECYQPKPGMQDFLRELKKEYEIALLTNLGDIFDEANEKIWHYEKLFDKDKMFVSSKLKMRKPHDDIFLYVLDKLERKPEEVIFIDDRKSNLDPAKNLGMQVYLFKTPEEFKNDIKSILEQRTMEVE